MVLEFPNGNPYSYILHFDLELLRASQSKCSSILKTGFSALCSESAVMLRLRSSVWRRWLSVWVQCGLWVPFPCCCMVSLVSLPCISGTPSGLPCVLTSRRLVNLLGSISRGVPLQSSLPYELWPQVLLNTDIFMRQRPTSRCFSAAECPGRQPPTTRQAAVGPASLLCSLFSQGSQFCTVSTYLLENSSLI